MLGTVVTILDPRSILLISHFESSFRSLSLCNKSASESRGANWATCAVVVYTRKPDATVKELALFANRRIEPSLSAMYSLPVGVKPMNNDAVGRSTCSVYAQNSGKLAAGSKDSAAVSTEG